MKRLVMAAMLAAFASAAHAQPTPLKPELAGLGFLVGDWSGGKGQVADTGGTSAGESAFSVEADGAVLLRRDQTRLFDREGKPDGGFAQVMMIYADAGGLKADYVGGGHMIHYVSAKVEPGHSVTFTSAEGGGQPQFRLTYQLTAPGSLSVAFAMAPPGGLEFRPIAAGALSKAAP